MLNVKIKRKKGADIPVYSTPGSVGADLTAFQSTLINPGTIAKIPTGVIIQVPDGFFIQIVARSSLSIKKGLMLSNSVGIIDSDYCGSDDEILISVYNFLELPVLIKKGERIAQAIILPYFKVKWVEQKEELSNLSRGGFGSTGGLGLEVTKY